MKRTSLLFALSFTLTFALFGGHRSASDYIKGEIDLMDGKTIAGYIEYYEDSPGILQKGIDYLTPEVYQLLEKGEKIKGKQINSLKPKEVKEIRLSNDKKFIAVKYADLTAVGAASIPQVCIFEVVVEGKINLYKKFPEVGGLQVVSGEEAAAIMDPVEMTKEQKIEKAQSVYEILIFKDSKMPKSISNIKLTDFISDNEAVLDEFNNNSEYSGIRAMLSSKIKPGNFNSNHPKYAAELIQLIQMYNE